MPQNTNPPGFCCSRVIRRDQATRLIKGPIDLAPNSSVLHQAWSAKRQPNDQQLASAKLAPRLLQISTSLTLGQHLAKYGPLDGQVNDPELTNQWPTNDQKLTNLWPTSDQKLTNH